MRNKINIFNSFYFLGGGSLAGGSSSLMGKSASEVSHLRRATLELQAERKRRKEVENELTALRQQ